MSILSMIVPHDLIATTGITSMLCIILRYHCGVSHEGSEAYRYRNALDCSTSARGKYAVSLLLFAGYCTCLEITSGLNLRGSHTAGTEAQLIRIPRKLRCFLCFRFFCLGFFEAPSVDCTRAVLSRVEGVFWSPKKVRQVHTLRTRQVSCYALKKNSVQEVAASFEL